METRIEVKAGGQIVHKGKPLDSIEFSYFGISYGEDADADEGEVVMLDLDLNPTTESTNDFKDSFSYIILNEEQTEFLIETLQLALKTYRNNNK